MERVYVHYEGDPDFTLIVRPSASTTFLDVKKQFVSTYNERFPQFALSLVDVCVSNANRKKVYPEGNLLSGHISDKEDIYVVEKSGSKPNVVTARVTPTPAPVHVATQSSSKTDLEEAESHKNKGNEFMKAKRFQEAIKEYSIAISIMPSQAIYYANRSQACLDCKQYDDAITDAEKCIAMDNSNAKAYFRKGTALLKLQRFTC